MILVDTSVWVDHLRRSEARLVTLLESAEVLVHSFVIGELACGSLRHRSELLKLLSALPAAPMATHAEALAFIERHALGGRGIGFLDVHLLAATVLSPGARLWTRDKRLSTVAEELNLAWR